MTSFKKIVAIVLGTGLTFASLSPNVALANTPANPYVPIGQSWINVPEASKVYLENFGDSTLDDEEIFYVGVGVTCTSNNVTAVGPFLTARDLSQSECLDAASNPIDPIDNTTRTGATPFGTTINFYGTDYTSAWPTTNGGLNFDVPGDRYDNSVPYLAVQSQSSMMLPFGGDLEWSNIESNFWSAKTEIDGNSAVVFSWEKFHTCCGESNTGIEDMSFQLVLIALGNGDFNAYFNYDSVLGFNQGYHAPAFFIDLETGVTVASNFVVSEDVQFAPEVCSKADTRFGKAFGTATDPQFNQNFNMWFKRENLGSKTISIWSDNTCVTPISIAAVQNVAQDGYAYLELSLHGTSNYAVAAGWATYNTSNKKIVWTELLRNQYSSEFINGTSSPLITRSLNTTVPGRFVIGQRGGQTVTDGAALASAAPAAVTKIVKHVSKSIRFSISTKFLTKAHKAKLKKSVKAAGKDATYVVTGTAGMLPGVTKAHVNNLAKLRANIVKAYLVKLGVKKTNITIKTKVIYQGIVPKTKILASYLTS